jgi:hypothetical protein
VKIREVLDQMLFNPAANAETRHIYFFVPTPMLRKRTTVSLSPKDASGCSAATLDLGDCRKLTSIPLNLMLEVATPAFG